MVVKYKRISSLSFTVWEHFAFQTVLKLKLWHFNMCYRWNFCLILTINIWDLQLQLKFTSAVFLWSWKILDVLALINKQTKKKHIIFCLPGSGKPNSRSKCAARPCSSTCAANWRAWRWRAERTRAGPTSKRAGTVTSCSSLQTNTCVAQSD